jgi:translation initiation factor 2 beta subunit (eIF-2beta)/eIF-5
MKKSQIIILFSTLLLFTACNQQPISKSLETEKPKLAENEINQSPQQTNHPQIQEEAKANSNSNSNLNKHIISSDKKEISFNYDPNKLFILDRSKAEGKIFISANEIEFNDFLGAYATEIEIFLNDQSQNHLLQNLTNETSTEKSIQGKKAILISGKTPATPPYLEHAIFAAIFPEEKISIIANDFFNSEKNIDLESAFNEIVESIRFSNTQ